jgi:hypothetical protein
MPVKQTKQKRDVEISRAPPHGMEWTAEIGKICHDDSKEKLTNLLRQLRTEESSAN